MAAALLDQEDFEYQVKDSKYKEFYGTQVGYPILEFTPTELPESKGRNKHRPGIILSRVFKLKKHRQRSEDNKRQTTYSFIGTKGLVFAVHFKGVFWGGIHPPDPQQRTTKEFFSNPNLFIQNQNSQRCIYDFREPKQVTEIINNYQAATFTR